MKRTLFSIAMVLLGATASFAQPTPQQVDEPCLLATDKEAWVALGLTSAQLEEVEGIQTTCKTACAATSETGQRDPSAGAAVMLQHEERVRNLLTDEQYKNWLKWCEERSARGSLK